MQRLAIFCALASLGACAVPVEDDAPPVANSQAALTSGTTLPHGVFEAVGEVRGLGPCTGTVIAPRAVLSAAHCFCAGVQQCIRRGSFILQDVRPVDDPATSADESRTRVDVSFGGDVILHPDATGLAGYFDYALMILDQPIHERVVGVEPIQVEPPEVPIYEGDYFNLLGMGLTGAACDESPPETVEFLNTDLDLAGDENLLFVDPIAGMCDGDSGGPALSSRTNRISGVAVDGREQGGERRSYYARTSLIYDWLAANACGGGFDPAYPNRRLCDDPMCPCQAGEGHCDSDSECAPGIECVPNAGAAYGLPSDFGVCGATPPPSSTQASWTAATTAYDGSYYAPTEPTTTSTRLWTHFKSGFAAYSF